jgi:hypothetical protein
VADWFFGTSDLRCGLLKHIFNGYDTRAVRFDLKRSRNTTGDIKVGPVQMTKQ